MVALWFVDALTIVANSYPALFLRVMDDVRELRLYRYVLVNVVVTVAIFLVLNLYNREWFYVGAHEVLSIIGVGEVGGMIITEFKTSQYLNQKVICVIDDNSSKNGKYIHGIRIVDCRDMIEEDAKKCDVKEIILAVLSTSTKEARDILRICNRTGCN